MANYHHPDHMTGAELQTLREAAGMTRESFADVCGVQARTVKHWEQGRSGVPADAAAKAQRRADWCTSTAGQAVAEVRMQAAAHGEPLEVVLIRYRETLDMHPDERAPAVRADVHGGMITLAACMLRAQGLAVRVVWFEPEAFNQWRERLEDTKASRAAWAAAQAIDRQAKPYKGDQPPAGAGPTEGALGWA